MTDEQHDSEPVGSLAEEAARLFAALAGVARDHGADLGDGVTGLGDRAASAVHDIDEHLATGGEECRYCPLCRAIALVRRTSPEAVEHLADSARSLSRAVAAMLATANVEDRRAQSQDAQSQDAQGRDGSGVEHIDLDDAVEVEADEPDPEQEEER